MTKNNIGANFFFKPKLLETGVWHWRPNLVFLLFFLLSTYQTKTFQSHQINPRSFQAEHFRPKSCLSFRTPGFCHGLCQDGLQIAEHFQVKIIVKITIILFHNTTQPQLVGGHRKLIPVAIYTSRLCLALVVRYYLEHVMKSFEQHIYYVNTEEHIYYVNVNFVLLLKLLQASNAMGMFPCYTNTIL